MDTKKLRQKILDLAIHGKLVSQDPNDEPASVLLERIRAEKERLIAEGKIKRSKKSATSDTPHYENRQVGEANVPFEVPEGWSWASLNSTCTIFGRIGFRGYTKDDLVDSTGAITLSPSNIVDGVMNYEKCTYISWEKYEESPEIQVQNDDILIVKTGSSYGKCAYVDSLPKEATINPQFVVLKFIGCNPRFLTYCLQSNYARKKYEEFVLGTAIPTFTQVALGAMAIPIPPIEEQERIVAEVEKLLSFVDLLDENTNELRNSITIARSKILNLAIHGKLVPQDANAEPASELLKRINPKAVASCDNPHYVGEIPNNWVWTTLGSIGKWQSGGTPSRMHKEYYGGNIPWLKTGDLNDGLVTDIPEHITELGLENSSAKLNPAGSVLIAMYGATIGKVGVLGIPATTNQACCACIEYKGITQQYLFLFLIANKANFVAAGGGGAQPNISKEIITKTLIPLPPIEEQNRIVAKVKELFSQLDMIEKSLQA